MGGGRWVGCGTLDYSDSPSPIPTLDWDFLDLDWTGSGTSEFDLGLSIFFYEGKVKKYLCLKKAIDS